MPQQKKQTSSPFLWNLFCTATVVGIWPRFIEPNIISTSRINLKVSNLPKSLDGFKILQISDLHLNLNISDKFLDKIVKKCDALKPDLIAFTGDFLCYSQMVEPDRLLSFLKRFKAPHGCFAVLGNHDYASCVSVNDDGDYDVIEPSSSSLGRAFSRLNSSVTLTKRPTERAKAVPMNTELLSLLSKSPFHLLHNETKRIDVNGTKLNICGLGEHTLARIDTKAAFKDYDRNFPGIILLHNPDGAPQLLDHPGDIILSGHSHGGQVNLPWIWKKFTLLENMQFKRGLVKFNDKWIYINRGIGSIMPFRWFATPEILLLTLESTP